MKVKIRTTPLTQASTATAFKLATKSMSTDDFSLSKELHNYQFFSSKLQKAWAPTQEQIFHMVVRTNSPTGGRLWLELGTNVWCESGDQSWDQGRPGANFGTNSRLVSEARCWSFHPLWGKVTPNLTNNDYGLQMTCPSLECILCNATKAVEAKGLLRNQETFYNIWCGVRSDAQLSCTETRFQKCC